MRATIKVLILCSCLFSTYLSDAQQLTQTIRGTVYDVDTRETLIGAEVQITNLDNALGTVTDVDGNFILENVPVGRRAVKCTYVGYTPFVRDNIQLNSAKEYFLEIGLKSGLDVAEVVVTAYTRSNEPVNELAVSSVRRLDPEELQYHAATANDPSRLVMGFPGVQPSRDSRSDIVIRGNSSVGLLWRLEGIDIPNPNHFARRGSSGGGITVFSASMLGSSDFSVGAFPAEYGNAFSGVFDMNFRNGNLYNRENTFRAGLLGLDLATEGPIKEGKSSYLANFRYSTLGILNSMGLYLVGPRTSNNFQDFSFKIYNKGEKSQLSFWGIGGNSIESFRANDKPWTTYSDYTAYDFTTKMGALGIGYNYLLDDKSYIKLNFAVMGQRIVVADDTLNAQDERTTIDNEDFTNNRVSFHGFYKRTFSPQLNMKLGLMASSMGYSFTDEEWDNNVNALATVIQGDGNTFLTQPYLQFSYRPTSQFTVNFGAHAVLLALNNTAAIDPRLGIKYDVSDRTTLALSYGIHSRTLPLGSYFVEEDGTQPNINLDMIKANHLVFAINQLLGKGLNLHIEGYYQTLANVPISVSPDRIYWSLNDVQGFATEPLTGGGTGRNIGVDINIEKFFEKGAFFVLSGSVFNSTFQVPNDPTRYNTQYNGRYSATFTGGKTWQLNDNLFLEGGFRVLYNGGVPVTPIVNGFETIDGEEPVLDEANPLSDRVAPYLRPDLRLALRKNNEKTAYWLALDVQNFINRRNEDFINYVFDSETGRWEHRLQSALTPLITFQLDF